MRKSHVAGVKWWAKHWKSIRGYDEDYRYTDGASLFFKRDVIEIVHRRWRRTDYQPYPYSLCLCDFCGFIGQGVQFDCLEFRGPRNRQRGAETKSGNFCSACHKKAKRLHKREVACLETRTLINKLKKDLANGAN